ncbi:MAG: DNA alkylation repair protein [Bacteroidetes bacterium]|nr:DNA alkylation repair protein [Bacteroidota bacterium]
MMNKNTTEYVTELETAFLLHKNQKIALGQANYMKNNFVFFGIKTEQRRFIQKVFLSKENLPTEKELSKIITHFWSKKEQREFQYFAQELAFKLQKHVDVNSIKLFEYMVMHKSWWDTVDFIAIKLMGVYFKKYPEQKLKFITKWLTSNNMWLQRSAIIFQIKYKKETDAEILKTTILALATSKEFFIRKAIGWALREYSKTNPNWVLSFVNQTNLSALSKKEALRLIKNK